MTTDTVDKRFFITAMKQQIDKQRELEQVQATREYQLQDAIGDLIWLYVAETKGWEHTPEEFCPFTTLRHILERVVPLLDPRLVQELEGGEWTVRYAQRDAHTCPTCRMVGTRFHTRTQE